MTYLRVVALIVGTLCYCAPDRAQRNQARLPQLVSLLRLIAQPEQYAGALVSTVGYLRLEYEGDSLYVSETDCKNRIMLNAISIDVPDNIRKDRARFDNKYVLLTGTYELHQGTGVLTAGRLTNIRRAEPWFAPVAANGSPK